MATDDMTLAWPTVMRTMRPWTRWWWLGSAVDAPNLTRLLTLYRDAELGGVEITPIYGVQGQEVRDIEYLSPQWLDMLRHTLTEAERLDMGVDMPTGTGWPFGGPNVLDEDAEDKLVIEKTSVTGGQQWTRDFSPQRPQALAAVSDNGETVALLDHVDADGKLTWTAPSGKWTVYTVTQKWAGRAVKRDAPGSEGKCINPFSQTSLQHYLERFNAALADLTPGALRCQFHDSFEYLADWCADLFDEFSIRRGYDLRDHLPALAGDGDLDTVARVKTDYRETLSDLLQENFTQTWSEWAHTKGSLSRNQAHGSPGNLLDLYGTPDIPETEIFGGLGDPLVNKFASSPAHVLGKPLVSAETCTWLGEHFTVTLAQCKAAIDRLFTAGINHVFYHGTPYSPADVAWPGWLFYASTTFAPDDPLWHDFPTLNAYITRCQSMFQTTQPDNDVLLYWPLHDLWQTRPKAYMLEINGKWLTEAPIYGTARMFWDRGYAFDYVSDQQLGLATVAKDGGIQMPGGTYRTVVVPPCDFMPETTLETLSLLSAQGASVIFQDCLPSDVPGLADLAARRVRLQQSLTAFTPTGDLEAALSAARVRRESLADHPGLMFIRRRHSENHLYFLTNEGPELVNVWTDLAVPCRSAVLMDPMTGQMGVAHVRLDDTGRTQVLLRLPPGASLLVQTFADREKSGKAWPYEWAAGEPMTLLGEWRLEFREGGPTLPASLTLDMPGPWTGHGDDTDRFSGTACYATTFDITPGSANGWRLDLGRVADSACVRLDGQEVGTLIAPPFQLHLGLLTPGPHYLEIDVTNVAANRIRSMDRRGERWRIFREINFVDIQYRPFDASAWPVRPAGLLGPVQMVPVTTVVSGT